MSPAAPSSKTSAPKSGKKGVAAASAVAATVPSPPAVAVKRKPGRPKAGEEKPKGPEPTTKMIDGKLMRRGLGLPKRIMTGKPGRPRKEYVWVEVTKK